MRTTIRIVESIALSPSECCGHLTRQVRQSSTTPSRPSLNGRRPGVAFPAHRQGATVTDWASLLAVPLVPFPRLLKTIVKRVFKRPRAKIRFRFVAELTQSCRTALPQAAKNFALWEVPAQSSNREARACAGRFKKGIQFPRALFEGARFDR
jgi:hypothetical protein